MTQSLPAAWARRNYLGGDWHPAQDGARFPGPLGTREDQWPQSGVADLLRARADARAGAAAWGRVGREVRLAAWCAVARELERDTELRAHLATRFALAPEELEPHWRGLEHDVGALAARTLAEERGIAWLAPDWRELLRAPLGDLARVSVAGRAAVLVADARFPEIGERIVRAAAAAGLPAGVLGLLHGARRELLDLALGTAEAADAPLLLASGLAQQMAELRRVAGTHESRLRALRCGTLAIDAVERLETCAAEAVERAFGRGATLAGQLPGALGRVYCPARRFAGFTERLLAELECRAAAGFPAQVDDEAVARARSAWELGLDEGATCIAGGEFEGDARRVAPTVFTNVEPYMESARRQDPLPVLCLLRGA